MVKPFTTNYTMGECQSLVAPLLGMDPGELTTFIILGRDRNNQLVFGASPNVTPGIVPGVLRACADAIQKEISDA